MNYAIVDNTSNPHTVSRDTKIKLQRLVDCVLVLDNDPCVDDFVAVWKSRICAWRKEESTEWRVVRVEAVEAPIVTHGGCVGVGVGNDGRGRGGGGRVESW